MKFTIGYQMGEDSFANIVREWREHIAEVYFPWNAMPSGRAALSERRGATDWGAQNRLEEDLRALRAMGIRLDLLFNANCYGGRGVSQHLENQVISLLEHLEAAAGGVDVVTTTSLTVARTVKRHFPAIEVRASVNMRIGTVQGMSYVTGLFDSFIVQRDFNRDIAHLEALKKWADQNGKKLLLLANSGCLAFCSGQTFHDNLVAHEQEIDETINIPEWTPTVCWNLLRKRENWLIILQATWIRPEDLHRYEHLFGLVKLATRMHARPQLVVEAYAKRAYRGNLLDLFEPSHGPALAPWVIDNTRFPDDWFERTSGCDRQCDRCDYCSRILAHVLRQG
jgi:collagenase-like PrtC family protease